MKVSDSCVTRITKDVKTIITLEDNEEYIMCGEIIDETLEQDDIGPVFHERRKFEMLSEKLQQEIIDAAYKEFKRFR